MFKKRVKRTQPNPKTRISGELDEETTEVLSIPVRAKRVGQSKPKKHSFAELQEQYGFDEPIQRNDELSEFTGLDIKSRLPIDGAVPSEEYIEAGTGLPIDPETTEFRRRMELEAALEIDKIELPDLPQMASNAMLNTIPPRWSVSIEDVRRRLESRMRELEQQKDETEGQIQMLYEHMNNEAP